MTKLIQRTPLLLLVFCLSQTACPSGGQAIRPTGLKGMRALITFICTVVITHPCRNFLSTYEADVNYVTVIFYTVTSELQFAQTLARPVISFVFDFLLKMVAEI